MPTRVQIAVLQLLRIETRHLEGAVLEAFAAAGVAQGIRLRVVEQYAVAERSRIVRPGRQLARPSAACSPL